MKIQYASGRSQICPLVGTSISGNLSEGNTYYFWLQGRNDIGFNLPSNSTSVTVTANQAVQLTIVEDCYRAGENWQQFVISASLTNDHSESTVICVIDAVQSETQQPITLPKVIVFSEDSHLDLSRTPTSSLPSGSNLKEGMIRQYSTNGNLYRYHPTSTATVDGSQVLSAATGRWLKYVDGFNTYITDTENLVNGADTPLVDIVNQDRLLPLKYALDGSPGPHRKLWLVNNSTTADIPKGERVGFVIAVNQTPVSQDFEGLLKIVYEGIADPSTGLLDTLEEDGLTPQQDIGTEKPYSFEASDVVISRDIEPGFAWQCRVFPEFHSYQLRSLPSYQSDVAIYPFIFSESGTYNDASAIVGDTILSDPPTLRRVYPSSDLEVFVEAGSGSVSGYFFKNKAATSIIGLTPDTANQKIVINNNGDVYVTSTLESFEFLRALVSTASGESHTSSFSSSITADSSPILNVTVDYPTSIRPDYPDVIAGAENGNFYVDECIFFVRQAGSIIKKFEGFIPTNLNSDTFNLDWSLGTTVGSINTDIFGLWNPITPEINSATTSGSTTYEVACSFSYTGNAVSDISHRVEDGCIPEINQSLSEALSDTPFWKSFIASRSALASLESTSLYAFETRALYENGKIGYWTWIPSSLREDSYSVRPNDLLETDTGRWVTSPANKWGNILATNADLEAISSLVIEPFELRIVLEDTPKIWLFLSDSSAIASSTVIKPDNLENTDDGRWHLISGGATSGGGGGGDLEPTNLVYYLDFADSTGDALDTNDGLTDTSPWLTWSKVKETIEATPLNGGTLTIRLVSPLLLTGSERFLPSPVTPGKIIIETKPEYSNPEGITCNDGSIVIEGNTHYALRFVTFTSTVTNVPVLLVRNGATLDLGVESKRTIFNPSDIAGTALVKTESLSTCKILGNIDIYLFNSTNGSTVFWAEGGLIDFTQGTTGPVISFETDYGSYVKGCMYASQGRIQLGRDSGEGVTVSFAILAPYGSSLPEGIRFTAEYGGVIDSNGGGASFLPGNAAGVATTGYYI